MEIHFVELEKYDENISNVMDRWVNFLKKAGEYTKGDMPSQLKEIPTISKALEVLENMRLSEREREQFEARLQWLRDEKAAIASAERRGLEKGIAKGMEKEKYDVALNALKEGADVDFIVKITGLGENEVLKIKEAHNKT
jgi:predicted transposase/invertase (TIGR01784 family)